MKRIVVFSWMLAILTVSVAGGFAADRELIDLNNTPAISSVSSSTKGVFYHQNEYELRMRKLCRGVANVTLSVAEVPNQMFREAYRSSPITGSIVGIWKGVIAGGKRIAIGTWEVATFYHPAKNHYQPFIEPEVIFSEYLH